MKKVLLGLLFAVLSFGGAFFAHQSFAAELVDNTPDCDTVAIVRCGSMTESAVRANAAKGDVSKVYGAFGISQSELSGFTSGIVWKDGRVTMGNNYNQVVATGAITAGRWNNPKPGMTSIPGTDRAYKMPTKYFVTEGQTAWLKFDSNGKFLFAIIKSCGNPVIATPIVPKFACNDLIATPINRTTFTFSAKASASNAKIVNYIFDFGDGSAKAYVAGPTTNHAYAKPGTYTAKVSVTVKLNTTGGSKTVTSTACTVPVTVKPAPTYSCDSLKAAQINRTTYRFDAKGSVANGAKIVNYIFDFGDGTPRAYVAGPTTNHAYAKPGTYTAKVTLTVNAEGDKVVTGPQCTVKVTVSPEPTYSCDSLQAIASKTVRNQYQFNAKGSAANSAQITKYAFNFGDGKTADVTTNATTASTSHTYTAPGSYTASVTLTVKVGTETETKTVTGPQCTVKVTAVPAPSYSCDELKATKIERNKYGFAAKASADNGATITKYTFDFGDSKNAEVTTNAKTANTEHTYDKAGEYTVRTTVSVVVDGKTIPVTSDKCVVKVTVAPEPSYSCDALAATKVNRTTYSFAAKASAANGATIAKYSFNFGDGKTEEVVTTAGTASKSHEYAEAKEYTIRVTAYVTVNNQTIPVTSDKCVTKVTVEEKPETPVFECKSLGAQLIGEKADRNFKYNLTYTATGGATLRDVDFDFGDGSALNDVKPADLGNVTHKYAADGDYTTVATLYFNVNDKVESDKCEVKVNPQNPPEECKPGIPVGDERCNECKPGIPVGDARCNECKPGIPAGDERCEECKPGVPAGDERCEEQPQVLPSTGPEAIISGLVGTGAISYGAYSYVASRRALRNSLKG